MARVAAENQLGNCVAKLKKLMEDTAIVAKKYQWQQEQWDYMAEMAMTFFAAEKETACAPKAYEKVKSSAKLLERLDASELALFGVHRAD